MFDISKILGLEKFEKVLSRFDRPPLKVNESSCVGWRLEEKTCRACLDVCRMDAIDVSPAGCQVDFSLCDGCGLCAAVCPTGVFEVATGDAFLLAQIKKAAETSAAVAFCCSKTRAKTDKKTGGLAIELTCLGRLPHFALVAVPAFGGTQVWLNDDQCKRCELVTGLTVAQKTAAETGSLLDAFGSRPEITFGSKPPKRFGSSGERPDMPELGKYSRRDFFIAGFREALVTGLDLAEDTIAAIVPKEQKVLPYLVPRKHSYFLSLIRRLNSAPSEDKVAAPPIVQVEISGACTVCRACAVVCPTKALVVEEDGQSGSVNFSLAYCLSCGLCRAACLEGALTYQEMIEPAKLLTDSREPIYEFSLRNCRKCQQPFSSSEEDECSFCRQRAAKITYDSWS